MLVIDDFRWMGFGVIWHETQQSSEASQPISVEMSVDGYKMRPASLRQPMLYDPPEIPYFYGPIPIHETKKRFFINPTGPTNRAFPHELT
jgi:hypothetical protein